MVSGNPSVKISKSDLDRLIAGLTVNMVSLAECIVSPGWRLSFPGGESAAMHYSLAGGGHLRVGTFQPIPLTPHTFVIVPAMSPFRFEVPDPAGKRINQVDIQNPSDSTSDVNRYVAGKDDAAGVLIICGYIRISYGKSLDIFENLTMPIVEQFDESDKLDLNLRSALLELIAQEVGMGVMAASLVKQVLIALLRRSMRSPEHWLERFPLLSDPQIARALADMVAEPSAAHSVQSLANTAGLSRSRFMERFTSLVGLSPLALLRQLRMKEAANLLEADQLSVDHIANAVGYSSRSSFSRAFRSIYGVEPVEYRTFKNGTPINIPGKQEPQDEN
jgi:AraC family transcriptional activator of mtrCDE